MVTIVPPGTYLMIFPPHSFIFSIALTLEAYFNPGCKTQCRNYLLVIDHLDLNTHLSSLHFFKGRRPKMVVVTVDNPLFPVRGRAQPITGIMVHANAKVRHLTAHRNELKIQSQVLFYWLH